MPRRTQYIKASEIPKELKTEGRCYCHCWKCSALIVTFDATPVNSPLATPTTSIAEKVDRSNYNPDDENNTLNNTSLSDFSKSPDSIKSPIEPPVQGKIIIEPEQKVEAKIEIPATKEEDPKKEPEIIVESIVETNPSSDIQNSNNTVLENIVQIESEPEIKPEIEPESKTDLEPEIDPHPGEDESSVPETKPTELVIPEAVPVIEEVNPGLNVTDFALDVFEPIEITRVEKVFKVSMSLISKFLFLFSSFSS